MAAWTARHRWFLGARPRAVRPHTPRVAGPPRASHRKPRLQPERHAVRDRHRGRRRIRGTATDARRASRARLLGIRARPRPAPSHARTDRRAAVHSAIDARGAHGHRRRRTEGRRCRSAGTTDVGRGRALAETADVAVERQVQELVLATERWVGPATVLVNNAGMVDPMVPLARSNAALWLRSVAINVGGTYLATRAVLPGMLDRGYGRIVTISSGAADRPSAGWTAYAAGKAAIVQMTRSLALELEGTGVTANAFNPGYMDTEMQERIRRTSTADFPRTDEYRAAQREGKLKDPKEPARAVTYLVLPSTERNGDHLDWTDEGLRREVERAVPA